MSEENKNHWVNACKRTLFTISRIFRSSLGAVPVFESVEGFMLHGILLFHECLNFIRYRVYDVQGQKVAVFMASTIVFRSNRV